MAVSVSRSAAALAIFSTLAHASDGVTIFDDGRLAIWVVQRDGILEPSIPMYVDGIRIDDDATAGQDVFNVVEGYVNIPGTPLHPLAFADIYANGYVRPIAIITDGPMSFGTSVVTQPAFRPAGEPIDIVPNMLRGTGEVAGGQIVFITSTGNYGGRALFVCTRTYPRPPIGETTFDVEWTWRATQPIELEPASLGNDAFRLCSLSSMFANPAIGHYDARYLEISSAGSTWTGRIDSYPRSSHLFASPRSFNVGDSFTLHKDRSAVWNPGGPSVRVELVSVTGLVGRLGIQGWLDASTNPGDDSLNVWVEWLDAPANIPGGTQIQVTLRVTALPATDPGDIDHDGDFDRTDAWCMLAALGSTPADPTFNAYADLDMNDAVNCADWALMQSLLESPAADLDANGVIEAPDFFVFLDWFTAADPRADLTGDAILDSADFFAYLDLFEGC